VQNQAETSSGRLTSWRVVAIALVYPTLLTWLYFIVLARTPAAVQQTAYTIGKVIQFGFPAVWAWRYRSSAFGRRKWSTAGVLAGVVFGALIGVAIVAVYYLGVKQAGFFAHAATAIIAKVEGLGLMTPAAFVALGAFYALVHSLLEEYYWRWFVFARLTELTRLPAAIVISSAGFMAHHVLLLGIYFGWGAPVTWLFSLAVGIGGAAWAWLYQRSGSLIGPWLSHLLVDAAIFVVGYDLVFC
jgi:membrane protease YdiL (CAAX protease family)